MPIRQLPIELANQIAAGEVVERPASVVKELVENSLDAGADQLVIDVENGGIKRIRIRDNGCGISKDELALALSRHATSKIASLDDLEAIQSLGFRGEALASISSVSRLRLTSKPAQQSEAWQAWTAGRDMAVQIEPAAHPDGTSIDIQDIFFNTPARRKFLRTEKTEFAHIDETLKRIALSRFDVDITLNHQGKRVRHYPRVKATDENSQRRRVAKVCGAGFADSALAISANADPYQLSGWIAPAEACRHQADIQYCFVNGRMMKDKLLSHAIRQAYERYLLPERVPTYVLYFCLPPQQVDVNVHPAKHEVRFHQQRQVHDFIMQAVANALSQQPPQSPQSADQTPAQAQAARPQPSVDAKPAHGYQTKTSALNERLSGYRAGPSILPNAAAVVRPRDESEPAAVVEKTPSWRALTVVRQRWLLMKDDEQVAWLDLQTTQRKVLTRQLQQQLQQGLSGQPLLVEVSVDLKQFGISPQQVLEQADTLNRCGLNYRLKGSRLVVDTVPSMLRQGNVAYHCVGLIRTVLETQQLEQLAAWLAMRGLNESYSLTQAEYWLNQWQQQLGADRGLVYDLEPPAAATE